MNRSDLREGDMFVFFGSSGPIVEVGSSTPLRAGPDPFDDFSIRNGRFRTNGVRFGFRPNEHGIHSLQGAPMEQLEDGTMWMNPTHEMDHSWREKVSRVNIKF